jgi:cellulose synthase/poly-beta-1,6-N-acetylglucosamine synthase-like glycosyltransferase
MGLVPQYGGTVGGVRVAALREVGGWHDDVLAEDTDLTYRLLLEGWKTVYENRAECYEEVPESWPSRIRQIMRWARGHNQSLWRHFGQVFLERHVGFWERVDGLALLGVYALSPLIVLGWICAIVLFYLNVTPLSASLLALLAVVSYGALGNFAAFFEVATASFLDGSRERIRLLPLNFLNFLISLVAITRASIWQMIVGPFTKRENGWDKTARYRVHSLT